MNGMNTYYIADDNGTIYAEKLDHYAAYRLLEAIRNFDLAAVANNVAVYSEKENNR